MGDNNKKEVSTSSQALKAGIWYTICNFLFRGMAFITTPIFARLLTKSEMGMFTNYSSWITILTVITAMDLQTSIIRSKLEYEDDIDSYIYSILSFTSMVTLLLYGIVFLFQGYFVRFFGVEMKYINIMFLYLFATPAYQMLITKHRAFYKYKSFVVLTGIAVISSTFLSLIMVLLMENNFAGRVWGFYFPYIIIGLVIYVLIVKKGKKIKIKYWKYACTICVPLIPHLLSFYLLDTSDKILITQISGSTYTAIYSIAYSCFHIVTILLDSMNKAWAPWLLENLHSENYMKIKEASKKYISIFVILVVFILMFVPEFIFILGGKEYIMGRYCLPPLVTSCVFQFIYTMYVNVEFYKKKTGGVAIATTIAAILNVILNLIFIPMSPQYGYIIAAYTTLVGYVVLFILHFYLVKRMKMAFVYDIKFIIFVIIITLLISGIMNILYSFYLLRYGIIICYILLILSLLYKNRKQIMKVIGKSR